VLLLSRKEPDPVVEAFATFALSKEGQAIVDEIFISYHPLRVEYKQRPQETWH
jgi:hypothetical protein